MKMIYKCNKKDTCNQNCTDINTKELNNIYSRLTCQDVLKNLIFNGYYCKIIKSKVYFINIRKLKLDKINERR